MRLRNSLIVGFCAALASCSPKEAEVQPVTLACVASFEQSTTDENGRHKREGGPYLEHIGQISFKITIDLEKGKYRIFDSISSIREYSPWVDGRRNIWLFNSGFRAKNVLANSDVRNIESFDAENVYLSYERWAAPNFGAIAWIDRTNGTIKYWSGLYSEQTRVEIEQAEKRDKEAHKNEPNYESKVGLSSVKYFLQNFRLLEGDGPCRKIATVINTRGAF